MVVPRTNTDLTRRAFSVAAPSIWNSLLSVIRLCDSTATFKRHLKTHLFSSSLKTSYGCSSDIKEHPQNIGVTWSDQSSSTSSAMSPLNRAHMTSFSPLVITMCQSCTIFKVGWLEFNVSFQHKYSHIRDDAIFEIYRVICQKSYIFVDPSVS